VKLIEPKDKMMYITALLLPSCQAMLNNNKNGNSFWYLIKPFRGRYLLGLFCLTIIDILELVPPLLIKSAVDTIEKNQSLKLILLVSIGYVIVYIIQGYFRFRFRMYFGKTSFSVTNRLMKKIYQHLLRLSPSYFDKTRTGEIMSRCTNDVQAVRMFLGPGILISCDTILY